MKQNQGSFRKFHLIAKGSKELSLLLEISMCISSSLLQMEFYGVLRLLHKPSKQPAIKERYQGGTILHVWQELRYITKKNASWLCMQKNIPLGK